MRTPKRSITINNARPTSNGAHHINVTYMQIEDYLHYAEENGLKKSTLSTYQRSLNLFYNSLPRDKRVDETTLPQMRDHLLAAGYHPRSVNVCLSVANNFLDYLGQFEFKARHLIVEDETIQPEITRAEYLRLLSVAKALKKERAYLLVKLFATSGISLQDLMLVTVEAIQAGNTIASQESGARIRIAGCLREELIAYTRNEGIREGPIFVTRTGALISRAGISDSIRRLCSAAKVPEEKGNPKCLQKLYFTTISGIENSISVLVDQAYNKLLEKEQDSIGWSK